MTKKQEQAIRDAAEKAWEEERMGFPQVVSSPIIAAIRAYDEQVNGKTAQDEQANIVMKAIDAVTALLKLPDITDCQRFNIRKALTYLDLALRDDWEDDTAETDILLEIKAFSTKTLKAKELRSAYITDDNTLCIKMVE